ncbi:MAG: FKBP-type peptidyl-prolyl cis-trans isomerase [Nevskiales bacterium]
MQIAERRVAYFHYTLSNADGEVLDSSDGSEPLAYLHGRGNLISGMEKALSGKKAGDKFQITLPPEDGYGLRDGNLVQMVPKSAFGGAEPKPGMRFQAESDKGPTMVVVTKVEGDLVTVDGNHELAGVTLNFAVEITKVRDATLEELAHGHVHGRGGHHQH